MQLVVIGDIHAQEIKLWRMLRETGLADRDRRPTERAMKDADYRLVLLGDLVHAKSRERYAELCGLKEFDEYNPEHLRAAETRQEQFLREVMAFQKALPSGRMVILMGNHDFNAVTSQGPLRTDDVTHLEWKEGQPLPQDLHEWISAWPYEFTESGIHCAHVGPLPEHNRFDQDFYLENRRRWLQVDRDFLADTPHRLGVYGHTPVRGGLNLASQGHAILLDTNGFRDEYSWLLVDVDQEQYRVRMQGLYFDEIIER